VHVLAQPAKDNAQADERKAVNTTEEHSKSNAKMTEVAQEAELPSNLCRKATNQGSEA
jgi:hypothetical protein